MFAPKRLDLGWTDLLAGLLGCVTARDREHLAARLERQWSPVGDAIACLSVRTGFDLYLSALDLPRGAEVLVSAITIPHMVRIIEDHGLVPVPIDLDMQRLAVRTTALERAVTPATRAVVVAHLFGSRMPLEPIVAFARARGLLLIEDCAQAYAGPEYTGHAAADVSLFSFGTIKTATALGGALVRIRDRRRLEDMRRQQGSFPVQARAAYARRLLKMALLKGLTMPAPYGVFVRACRLAGIDHDALAHGAVRGFGGQHLRDEIRKRPAAPLLALLGRRLRRFDATRLDARAMLGTMLARDLAGLCEVPGRWATEHSHWVFPILAREPEQAVALLRRAGFDATRRGSLVAVDPPPGREHLDPVEARQALARIVYVPLYPDLSPHTVQRLAATLAAMGRQVDSPIAPGLQRRRGWLPWMRKPAPASASMPSAIASSR
jgi:dTDP-4-amino-4,6-dideoxygalactose transaminase